MVRDLADSASGGGICASFLVFGGLSVLLSKPWRRRVEAKRRSRRQLEGMEVHIVEQETKDPKVGVGCAGGKGMELGEVQQGLRLESSLAEKEVVCRGGYATMGK